MAEFSGEVVVALIVVKKGYGAEGGHHEPVSAATRRTSQSGAYLMKGGLTYTWLVHTLEHHWDDVITSMCLCFQPSSAARRVIGWLSCGKRGCYLTFILGFAGRHDDGYFHMH